jgi:hypothetical protein
VAQRPSSARGWLAKPSVCTTHSVLPISFQAAAPILPRAEKTASRPAAIYYFLFFIFLLRLAPVITEAGGAAKIFFDEQKAALALKPDLFQQPVFCCGYFVQIYRPQAVHVFGQRRERKLEFERDAAVFFQPGFADPGCFFYFISFPGNLRFKGEIEPMANPAEKDLLFGVRLDRHILLPAGVEWILGQGNGERIPFFRGLFVLRVGAGQVFFHVRADVLAVLEGLQQFSARFAFVIDGYVEIKFCDGIWSAPAVQHFR